MATRTKLKHEEAVPVLNAHYAEILLALHKI